MLISSWYSFNFKLLYISLETCEFYNTPSNTWFQTPLKTIEELSNNLTHKQKLQLFVQNNYY